MMAGEVITSLQRGHSGQSRMANDSIRPLEEGLCRQQGRTWMDQNSQWQLRAKRADSRVRLGSQILWTTGKSTVSISRTG